MNSALQSAEEQPDDLKTKTILVNTSALGKTWLKRIHDQRDAELMSQRLGIDRVLAEILSARGISPEQVEGHLSPSLKKNMPDPLVMTDMDKAIERLAAAVSKKEKIGVFGDYDVDGTTSSALLARYFNALNVPYEVYLPDRITEGYGPNIQAFGYLQEKGCGLCLTVDCGAMAHEILEQVRLDGMDVIVLDHHQMSLPAPPAVAVVNPNRPDDLSGLEGLSAVGVTFMALAGTNRKLRQDGFFTGIPEPNLLHWLDLVALGLVCDVMPLTGMTRVLVRQGLNVMGDVAGSSSEMEYPGLKLLAEQAGASGEASAYHLGFVLGPRINAAGRIGHANLAYNLMKEKNRLKAIELTDKLESLNKHRQHIEAEVLDQAVAQIQASSGDQAPLLALAVGEGWHPGVIGIVAGRLKEKYGCPAIVIAVQEDTGKGSGRSVEGLDLGALITAAKDEGLLLGGGGHAMAAGLSIEKGKIASFEKFLRKKISAAQTDLRGSQIVHIDCEVGLPTITREFHDLFAAAGPFGNGFPEPRFMISNARIKYADVKGGKHIACALTDEIGNTARAIAFRAIDTPLADILLNGPKSGPLHIAGKIKPDDWRGGNAAQFIIDDVTQVEGL